jgi:hypothetical protein
MFQQNPAESDDDGRQILRVVVLAASAALASVT